MKISFEATILIKKFLPAVVIFQLGEVKERVDKLEAMKGAHFVLGPLIFFKHICTSAWHNTKVPVNWEVLVIEIWNYHRNWLP